MLRDRATELIAIPIDDEKEYVGHRIDGEHFGEQRSVQSLTHSPDPRITDHLHFDSCFYLAKDLFDNWYENVGVECVIFANDHRSHHTANSNQPVVNSSSIFAR